MEDETRRSRRSNKYRLLAMAVLTFSCIQRSKEAIELTNPFLHHSGDFQTADFSDIDDSDEDRDANRARRQSNNKLTSSKKRQKECPGCSAMLPLPTKECIYCDFVFTTKSMLLSAQATTAESSFIQSRFPFEPDRVRSIYFQMICLSQVLLTASLIYLRRRRTGLSRSRVSLVDVPARAEGDSLEKRVRHHFFSYRS